ncbi:MAG: 4a-hydroxytetrahydrobiopterin dehydratase [Candidatus Thiosymbion ectosymbiont of Robbea hypermnestra]|nr:4a-hydroxytetrahydrobiopterin dehydratase [Candidatus Thiosymbion ectosymbiont of Robbea hypermnestra]
MSDTKNSLLDAHCEVCRVGAPAVTDEEIEQQRPLVPEWRVIEDRGVRKLTRTYETTDYRHSLALVDAVGGLAESEGHHPVMLVEYARVTVWWWTHKIHDLHRNDFIMAAKCDRSFAELA